MPKPKPLPPFGAHDYRIEFPREGAAREVSITAHAAQPLRVGDSFTVGQPGCFYDLLVEQVTLAAGGRWAARCSIADLQWI